MGLFQSKAKKEGQLFREAIDTGDTKAIKECLARIREQNLDISMPVGLRNEHPVLQAVNNYIHDKGSLDTIKLLIDEGCEVNRIQEDELGFTPLYAAVRKNKLDLVKYLLERKANPDQAIRSHDYPLVFASGMGYIDQVKALVEAGANCNVPSPGPGGTPMVLAVQSSHTNSLEICKTLIGGGCDVHKVNNVGRTVMHAAAEAIADVILCMDYLVGQGTDLNVRDNKGFTPLMLCSQSGKKNICAKLLGFDVDIGITNNEGKTALDLARQNEHNEIEELILSSRQYQVEECNLLEKEGTPETNEESKQQQPQESPAAADNNAFQNEQ
eukprot:GHVU01139445.1.p1 GENE.GHVU01139445.1~~GHVU01139445.1.p1  ORF type:complete len:327 (+),score=53.70 GHVU01139445.1:88-1068(+)